MVGDALQGPGERAHLLAPGITLETSAEDIGALFHFEDLRAVIIVGRCFAGSLVSLAADRMPGRLRRLDYLDAMVLQSGRTPADV